MKIVRRKRAMRFSALVLSATAMVCPRTAMRAQTAPAKWAASSRTRSTCPGQKYGWTRTSTCAEGRNCASRPRGTLPIRADTSYKGKSRTLGTFGPDGLPRGWADLIHQYAVKDAGHGALIGRIGSDAYAQPFLVGASKEYDVPVAGRLFLGINQSMSEASTADGSFHVKIEVLNEGSAEATSVGGPVGNPRSRHHPRFAEQDPAPQLRSQRQSRRHGQRLDRGNTGSGGSGIHSAGWVQVDKSVGSAVLNAVVGTLQKKDYLTMPMSTLFLFNRPQDYGFAHGEPVKVAMSRNHLRVWKSPYEVDGRPLWCVAATHDIGFERDQRNNGVTHKIDPAIDGEREYVNGTLSGTGLVVQRDHVTPADPLTTAKTATGGEFHSDGRVLVLVLRDTKTASN